MSVVLTCMLTPFKRHIKSCGFKTRKRRNCPCPIHVEGTLRGQVIRKKLDTRNWDAAQAIIREWESGVPIEHAITIRDAKQRFLKDAEGRNLHWTTFKKYKLVLRQLEDYSQERGFTLLKELTLESLRDFLPTLKDGPLAKLKKIERLRAFFRFCLEGGWIPNNPAKLLRPPIIKPNPTLPFSRDEMKRMLKRRKGTC